jgi:CheY-like chemotaxis protein
MGDPSAYSVLVVDDEPYLRDVIALQLEEAGFEARQAEDGIDGLVKLRGTLPDVIISDLQMPRMSGLEFIAIVRKRFPSIPVIVLSGSAKRELPPASRPDRWFDKCAQQMPELLQAVRDLARKTPDRSCFPQVISTPVRTHPNGAGYFVLTCTDCLRLFQVASTPENKRVEQTAACTHCEACIPFLVESLEPE